MPFAYHLARSQPCDRPEKASPVIRLGAWQERATKWQAPASPVSGRTARRSSLCCGSQTQRWPMRCEPPCERRLGRPPLALALALTQDFHSCGFRTVRPPVVPCGQAGRRAVPCRAAKPPDVPCRVILCCAGCATSCPAVPCLAILCHAVPCQNIGSQVCPALVGRPQKSGR
jgi:hypothetical protein